MTSQCTKPPAGVTPPRAKSKVEKQRQYSTPRIVKRSLFGDGQELEAMIVACAAQRPGIETNALLDQIVAGAIQNYGVRDDIETIKIVGRNSVDHSILDDIRERYGNEHDPELLREHIGELNTVYFKFKRETPITQSDIDTFKACRCTDVANGQRFAMHFKGTALHSQQFGWLVWDGMRLAQNPKAARELAKQIPEIVRAEIKHLTKDMDIATDPAAAERFKLYSEALIKWAKLSASTKGIDNTLKEAATTPEINADALEFDTDPWLFNCVNETVDLRTGKTYPHNPKHLITKLCPHEYQTYAKCPRWLQFLDEVFEGDAELINYIQWLVGYSLTGSTRHHIFPIMHGNGRNGKGAFIRALSHAMGRDFAQALNPEEIMRQRNARHDTAKAALRGARFVACQETEDGKRLNEALIKSLTGGDRIRARFMCKDEFEFDPSHKLWLASNYKPKIEDNSTGMWERIRLIPFLRSFNADDKDPDLDEKLAKEAEGILAWAIRGHIEAGANEPTIPSKVREATEKYKEESDTLKEFIDECVMDWPEHKLSKQHLYDVYRARMNNRCEDFLTFNKRFAKRGYEEGRNKAGSCWIGIGVNQLPYQNEEVV